MYHKDIFCMRVKKLRNQAKEQQKDLAAAVGISQTAVSEIENGRRATSLENLALICLHYNVSADYLLGLSDEPRALTEHRKEGT